MKTFAVFFLFIACCSADRISKDGKCVQGRTLNATKWIDLYGMETMVTSIKGAMPYEHAFLTDDLPATFSGTEIRPFANHFIFLIRHNETAYFHKFPVDAVLHHYIGRPLNIYLVNPTTYRLSVHKLNTNSLLQIVPAGYYVAIQMAVPRPNRFTVFGCTLVPGTIPSDVVMAKPGDIPLDGHMDADLIYALIQKP